MAEHLEQQSVSLSAPALTPSASPGEPGRRLLQGRSVAIDPETFKNVLSRWASGITIVTCRSENGVHGMTASSFCSVSVDPPLILVCVNRRNRTHAYIQEQRSFGVHLLSTEMEEISNRCAGFRGEAAHRLDDLPHHTEVTGAPILDHALSWMDCSLWQAYDGGDHTIYVGEIQAAGYHAGEPLLWYRRGYRRLPESAPTRPVGRNGQEGAAGDGRDES